MAVELLQEDLKRIEEHGREAYPDECCGVLLGTDHDGRKMVTGILPLRNSRQANGNAQAAPQETTDLLKEAYRLIQQMEQKTNAARDWLERADAVVNSSRNRFTILPEDFVESDREARRRGVDILGFYHSHPDHPARPSEYDREHAWPWYTYFILKVDQGVPREMTSWLLSEDRLKFLPEELAITSGAQPSTGA